MRKPLFVAGSVATIVAAGAFLAVMAQSVVLDIEEVEPNEAYTEVTVAFTRGAYAPFTPPAEGDPVLGAIPLESFVITDGVEAVTPTSVTWDVASPEQYVLSFGAAVTPNETTIVVPAGQAADSDGALNVIDLEGLVVLTAADAAQAAAALAAVELDLKGLGAIPFMGAWFRNEGATVASDLTAQMEAAADELVATTTTQGPLAPLQAQAVSEARPRPLSDLLPDLPALDFAGAGSQQDVIDLLETLDGVDQASFTGQQLQLAFAPETAAAASGLASTQQTATPEGGAPYLPFQVGATTTFDLDLEGSLAIDLPATGTGVAVDLGLRPHNLAVAVDAARIGILGVSVPDLRVEATELVGTVVSCADCTDPAVGLIPTLTGDLAVVIPGLSFAGAAAGEIDTFSFTDTPTVTWNLGLWDLSAAEPNPAPSTVTGAAEFFAAELDQFANLDTRAVVLGLGWVSSWLSATGELDDLATKLPGLGLSIDDVLALSDQVGAEATRLAELVEGDPSAATPTDPTAQQLVDLLCQSELLPCEQGWEQLDGLAISPDTISYDLEFDVCKVLFVTPDPEGLVPTPTCPETGDPAGVDVTDGGPQLDLELANDLDGIDVSLRAGTWGGTASATLSVRLALDLRDDAELIADLGLTTNDYPQPDTPLTHQLRVGELCRTLPLALPGDTTPTAFLLANLLTPGDVADQLACDRLAFGQSGLASVKLTDPADGTIDHQVTAAEVCDAAALIWDVHPDLFRELNSYTTDAACAADVETAVNSTPVDDAADTIAPQLYPAPDFTYREPIDTSRVPIGFRVYLEPIGTEPLVDASLSIAGSGLGADVRLGFLDLDLTGTATAAPTATLTLNDPTAVNADRFDLATLARIADDADLATALTVDVAGPIDVDLTLANPVAFPTGAAQLRFKTADLGDVLDGTWAISEASSCDGTFEGLCYSLGDWTQLRDLSPAAAVQMVTGVLDQVSGLASADALNLEVPLLGASLQDMVEFNRSVGSVAGAVESRDPELLTQFQRAIEAGVGSLGVDMTAEEVTVELVQIDGATALTVQIPFVYSTSTDYPFSLDLADADLPFAIEPAEGGARLTAGADITYRPRVGVLLDGDPAIADAFVLDISSARDPILSATAGGELSGDVTAGPVALYLYGTASAAPTATLELSQLSTGTGDWLTAGEMSTLLSDGSFSTDLLVVDGDLSLDASIDWPFGADPTVAWDATLTEVLAGQTGTLIVSPAWDVSEVTLDLGTLVSGTTQTARFVGQGLASSEAMGTSLPLVGDELTKLATAGRDLQTIAVIVEDLWEDAQRESDTFVTDANATLQSEICTALAAVGDCTVTLELLDGDGASSGIATAQSAVLTFDIGKTVDVGVDGAQLLDVPGLDVEITDATFAPTASVGYRLGFVLGLDVTDGFYLEGLAIDGASTDTTRLLELFASADLGTSIPDGTTPSVQVGGVPIFDLVALDLSLSGSLSGDTAAGFAIDLPERLTLRDLVSRRGAFDRVLIPTLSLDSSALITVRSPEAFDGLPSVTFPLHFAWTFDEELRKGLVLPEPFLSIGDADVDSYVTVDATSLIEGVIRPALLEGAQYNPLAKADPVRDALNTQIPVIDTDVRSALEVALGREPSWQLFTFLLDLEDIARSINEAGPAQPYDIGGYQLLPSTDRGYFEANAGQTLWDEPEFLALKGVIDRISRLTGSGSFDPEPQTVPAAPGDAPRPGTADLSGAPTKSKGAGQLSQFVSLPALSQPLSLATLVMGGEVAHDISFLEVSPPPISFGYVVRYEQTLFDLDIAFLEANLSVALDGAVGVTLRVGFGYSSRGLTSGNPLYGIYLVDAYDGDRDLPAIALGARIAARVDGSFAIDVAGVDVANARFHGSGYVRLEGGLDLFDESLAISARGRGDGMFHLDEIATVVTSHRISAKAPAATSALCIFRPVVQLDAGLRFSGEARALGIKVWSGSFGDDWVLVNESVTCGYRYKVAQLEERRLILNAGPQYAADRFDGLGDVAESFDIRQAGGKLHVRWTGPNDTAYDELSFPLDEVDEIYGDLGVGNDEVVIQASVQVPAVLDGGPGNDILVGGSGDDQIDGGADRNYLAGGGGNNVLIAGPDGPAGDPTERSETLGICDGAHGTLAAARTGQSVTAGCTVVVAGTGDDVLEGGPRPVVYRLPGDTFGDIVVDHLGGNAVLDLRNANVGLRGTIAQAGISLAAQGSGTGSLSAFDPASVIRLIGTTGDDNITLTAGRDDLVVDGADGADEIIVQATAVSQTVGVTDSGADAGGDTLLVRGTSGADRYLLRAERSVDAVVTGLAADRGIVAVLDPRSGTDTGPAPDGTDLQDTDTAPVTYTGRADASQLVRYDSSIELLRVDGVAGQNEFGLDDVATETIIDGGRGSGVGEAGNRFQVGQIFGWYADETNPGVGDQAPFRVPLLPTDPVTNAVDDIDLRTRESIRGWVSYGITHETTINGGDGDDAFTVYSNRDTLNLNGISGDNVFTLRAFIENGSIVVTGGEGDDTFNYDFEYVDNEAVNIDGGEGFNTFVAIGTELQDGFVVRDDGVSVCRIAQSTDGLDPRVTRDGVVTSLPLQPDDTGIEEGDCGIQASTENVQRFVLYGLEGNNVFWVRSTADDSETFLIGGAHGSTYLLGDDGDLSGFGGTVDVVGDLLNLSQRAEASLRSVDLDFPPPVLFHGEVAYSPVDAMIPADAVDLDAEHRVVADASNMGSGETGELLAERSTASDDAFSGRLSGLSTAAAGTFTVGAGANYPGGIGYRGVDLLRVILGGGADTFEVGDTHPAYTTLRTLPVPGDEPDPLDDLLGDAAASVRDGRTELFAGGGNDTLSIDAISGRTWVELEAGKNELTVGTGVVTGVTEDLEVLGGSGDDTVIVDASDGAEDSGGALRADLDLRRDQDDSRADIYERAPVVGWDVAELTELEMAGLLRHDAAVETLRLLTGAGTDVANVRGSLAGVTELVTTGADDRFFVSDAAEYEADEETPAFLAGTLTDLVGDLDIVAGAGTNLLMVSDLDGGDGLTGTLDHDEIALDGLGTITYDADGTFAGGITLWTGGGDDELDVVGVRRDGDATTLAWEDRPTGDTRSITTLNTGDGDDDVTVDIHDGEDDKREDGFLVVNLGDGDDTLGGSDATLGSVVFGGPGNDDLTTGSGDDLVFGDEGQVWYGSSTKLGNESVANVNDGIAGAPTRLRSMATDPAEAETDSAAPSGMVNNRIDVGDGDDVAWGGLGNAWIEASGGRNALLGDHAEVWRQKSDGPVTVTTRDGFIDHLGRTRDFHYIVDVLGSDGGDDVILGGDDGDAIFAGSGQDVVVGGDAEDLAFGGDGDDIIWSGTGDDRVYGGNGDSFINVKQPSFLAHVTRRVHEPAWWDRAWRLAPDVDREPVPETVNGDNLLYGGRGRDVMQADSGGAGQRVGDRLIDWYGSFNLYLTCEGAYGAGWVQRQAGPGVPEALIALAELDGAYRAADQSSSGWRQLALVTRDAAGDNRNPPHPDHPGNNATCS